MHLIDCACEHTCLADESPICLCAVILAHFVHANPLCLFNQDHWLDCSRNWTHLHLCYNHTHVGLCHLLKLVFVAQIWNKGTGFRPHVTQYRGLALAPCLLALSFALPTLLRETARTLSLTHQNRCSLGALFHLHYHRVKACRDEAVQRLSPAGFDWAKIRSSLEERVILFPDFDLLWSLNWF